MVRLFLGLFVLVPFLVLAMVSSLGDPSVIESLGPKVEGEVVSSRVFKEGKTMRAEIIVRADFFGEGEEELALTGLHVSPWVFGGLRGKNGVPEGFEAGKRIRVLKPSARGELPMAPRAPPLYWFVTVGSLVLFLGAIYVFMRVGFPRG